MTSTRLAIRAARAFDGEQMIDAPTILIANGSITAVEQGNVAPPEGTEIVDLGDATLVPGLIDAHVHLAFDSSADPVSGIVGAKPHGVLPYGVQQFVDVGMSHRDALMTMTSRAADELDLEHKGRLAPGKDADILAVRGDPLVDATAMLNVEAVFRSGVRVR